MDRKPSKKHNKNKVCPWWIGYILLSPIRRLSEDPEKMVEGYVDPGMIIIDVGSAMGYFSIPLAEKVGPDGKVICVDLQRKMLDTLERRARKAGLSDIIETRICSPENLGISDLKGRVDFVLAMHVIHEMPDAAKAFGQIRKTMKKGSMMLFGEPVSHVSEDLFGKNTELAKAAGFRTEIRKNFKKTMAVYMKAV